MKMPFTSLFDENTACSPATVLRRTYQQGRSEGGQKVCENQPSHIILPRQRKVSLRPAILQFFAGLLSSQTIYFTSSTDLYALTVRTTLYSTVLYVPSVRGLVPQGKSLPAVHAAGGCLSRS